MMMVSLPLDRAMRPVGYSDAQAATSPFAQPTSLLELLTAALRGTPPFNHHCGSILGV